MKSVSFAVLAAAAAAIASTAHAQVTWTSSVAPAPTYATGLNFDETPLPAGVPGNVAANAYAAYGVTSITSNSAVSVLNGNSQGWTFFPSGNQAMGANVIALQFAYNLTALSVQFWESAPNFSPIGSGGASIDLYQGNTLVSSLFISNPFWQGNPAATLPTWFNVVANPGVTFNHVEFNGFSSTLSDTAAIDNLSWVPSPGAAGLLGLAGLAASRRRR
ncbi:MAG: hypothetical protein QM783_00425 [Phycisphaerales bacterium]